MIVIQQIERASDGITCKIEVDAVSMDLDVTVNQLDVDLRSLDFRNLSTEEVYELSNRDEFREFQKAVWRFVDGEDLELPTAITAS